MARSHPMLRMVILGNHFMVFLSSLIVMALASYFIHRDSYRGTHIIFQEVIATITLAIYLFGMVLPLIDSYGGYLMPLNLILSYLWLTSFIFSAQDWSRGRCYYTAPLLGNCGKKHTMEAFNFLGLFFLICNTLAEAMLWRSHRSDNVLVKNGAGHRTDNSAAVV
ncbi:membrane-associating domain-containing protein [Hirsutella rhossiliensis]|uniref:Membrane-associating domain-containing protein n=1 Tax=Hirsutella rhossiliensis TaxID=111463 RepID=A0A9P8N6C0_9HYPO|nr:membrane-associating domain-containing protein [Hirsutella rhossiliensis]KAH0967630.1 membrane-associating domain-containing protein [Hirsutella rhossiliensis]